MKKKSKKAYFYTHFWLFFSHLIYTIYSVLLNVLKKFHFLVKKTGK